MKRLLSILMILTLLMTSGCVFTKHVITPDNKEPEKTPVDTETETETETETKAPEKEVDWDGGLVMLRQAMIETPQVMAVAFLGYYNGEDLAELLPARCPTFCDNHPIFNELTTDMIIGGGNELYCVVAMDENSQISVNKVDESGTVTQVLHKCDGKKPILIAANGAGFSPDTFITLVNEDGWVSNYGPAFENDSLVSDSAVFDFTSYEDIIKG